MKQRISSYLVLFTLLLASTTCSHASSTGTISFTGLVKDDGTCKVEIGSDDQLVVLPTVATNRLAVAGQTAGKTKFTIKLKECNAEDNGRAKIKFKNANATNGLLNNLTTTGAQHVSIQLINATSNQIMLLDGTAADSAKTANTGIQLGGKIIQPQFDYYAQYYATGSATAGEVTARAEFEISYP